MSVEEINAWSTLITEVISTATAGITTLTAGVALAGLGTVAASSAFLALPVVLPAVLVGLVAGSKLVHASMLHKHRGRNNNTSRDGCLVLGDVQTDPVTSVRNRELVTGLGLGGVTASAAVVANHSMLYPGLGVAGGLSAGLAVAALGLTINALHNAVFAWQRYHAIQIPTHCVRTVEQYNKKTAQKELVQVSNKDDRNFAKIDKEMAGRAMYSSMVAALGWAAITTGSVAAAMSLAPIIMAASFLLGGVAIIGARLYNDGLNFGLFNKKRAVGDPDIDFFGDRLQLRSVLYSF